MMPMMQNKRTDKPQSQTAKLLSASLRKGPDAAQFADYRNALIELIETNEDPAIVANHRDLLLEFAGTPEKVAEHIDTMRRRLSAAKKIEAAKRARKDRNSPEAELQKLEDEMAAYRLKWQSKVDLARSKITAIDRILQDGEQAKDTLRRTPLDPAIHAADAELREQAGEATQEINFCQRALSSFRRPDDISPCPKAAIESIRDSVRDGYERQKRAGKIKDGESIDDLLTHAERVQIRDLQEQIQSYEIRLAAAKERMTQIEIQREELDAKRMVP